MLEAEDEGLSAKCWGASYLLEHRMYFSATVLVIFEQE